MKKAYILLLALLALSWAACTEDMDTATPDPGNELTLKHIQIGVQTRAAQQPIEGQFTDGSRLEAIVTLDEASSNGTYTYNNNNNAWASTVPAYWQNMTDQHTVSLRTPLPNALPDAYTANNWHTYDLLAYYGTTSHTTDFILKHAMAQLCVSLTPGEGLLTTDLTGAVITATNVPSTPAYTDKSTITTAGNGTTNITLLHDADRGAWYALLIPGQPMPTLRITLGQDTYTYTPTQPAPTLQAGLCTTLTLKVNQTEVAPLNVSCEDWVAATATSATDDNITIIDCTAGNLSSLWPSTDPTQVLITGTINDSDIKWLGNEAKSYLTYLCIMATGADAIPDGFFRNNNGTKQLQTLILPHITSIGEHAFREHPLTHAYLPDVKTIETYAFYQCRLQSISLPEATQIGNNAFRGCPLSDGVSLPKVTTIGDGSFRGCQLRKISLPHVTSIGASCFVGEYGQATNYTLTQVYMPQVETIGEDTFIENVALRTLIINGTQDGSFFLPTLSEDGIFYKNESLTNLLLCGNVDETMFAAHRDDYTNWGNFAWPNVYYDLRPGEAPEDPASYNGHWTRP